MTKYLIIGGGTTTARAVEGVREVDADGSITTTEQPWLRAAAATSSPIQPAPTMATRPPSLNLSSSARESSSVRSENTPGSSAPGTSRRRTDEPVASSSRSHSSCSPLTRVTVWASGSMLATGSPSRRSTCCSRYQASSCGNAAVGSSEPSRMPFDKGGRS